MFLFSNKIIESTPKSPYVLKYIFWRYFNFSQLADAQASTNLKKVKISSKICNFTTIATFRSRLKLFCKDYNFNTNIPAADRISDLNWNKFDLKQGKIIKHSHSYGS